MLKRQQVSDGLGVPPPFDGAISDAETWWMNSPEHRDNILGSHYRQVGIGTAIDGDKMYISAVFTD